MINSIEIPTERVFDEVGEEVDYTAQLYADGLEKKRLQKRNIAPFIQ